MNIRPATKDDVQFLKKMLYEAARWNPDWPREPIEEVLGRPGPHALPPRLGPGGRWRGGCRGRCRARWGGVVPAVHGRGPRLRLRG